MAAREEDRMLTRDARSELPFVGDVFGYAPKTSLTFHWNGGPVLDGTDDTIRQLVADANLHIRNGWGGISYHDAIARDGTLVHCRDPRAVLAAVANADGNAHSRMVQVMCGTGQSPTPAQWATMREVALGETGPIDGHRDWSPTECPGAEIYDWIQRHGWKEDAMDAATYARDLEDLVKGTIRVMVEQDGQTRAAITALGANPDPAAIIKAIGTKLAQ